jgi:Cys-tRNA(Pro)/Cys-tRNA(Cys) deacylase
VLKTQMALIDGKPLRVIIPSDKEVSMKKLAAAFGGKSAEMTKPLPGERSTTAGHADLSAPKAAGY